MTRHKDPFNRRLLSILYTLVRNKRYMNSYSIAEYLSYDNKRISKRTVERWFRYLNKSEYETGFAYYPYFRYEALGLNLFIIILTNLKNKELLDTIPYITHLTKGYDGVNRYSISSYSVPVRESDRFKEFWKYAKKKGLFDDYLSFESKTPVAFYSPFHEIVSKNGKLIFPNNYDIDNSHFTKLLTSDLRKSPPIKMHDILPNNPLIVPIVIEYSRRNLSSKQVWLNIKKKMKNEVLNYIGSNSDGVGIRYVQKTMRFLNQNFDSFFQQIRISYYPFYKDNVTFYLLLKLKNRNSIVKLAEEVSKHSISIVVCPELEPSKNLVMIYVLTNIQEMDNVLYNIVPDYVDRSWKNKVIIQHYEEAKKHWKEKYTKLDYKGLFNLKKCEWIYNQKKYLRKLENLSN